jgi:16S rRNA (adenine1518-N6/adenine1519-N6)-dimethyltransferase
MKIKKESPTYKKKSLGQHFLEDHIIAEKIVSCAEIGHDSSVIEIGPGGGSITKWIYEAKPKQGILVEIDSRFIPDLRSKFPEFQVVNQDICDIDLSKENYGAKLIITGNLPYNVSTRILEYLVSHHRLIDRMVLMFQKEVGDRIYAQLATKDYGRLTLLAQEFFETEKLFVIKPGAFNPPPKVDSVVILFSKRTKPLIDVKDRKLYERMIKHVFSNRRKMMRRSLKALCDEDTLEQLFAHSGVVPTKRPEELTIQEFAGMSNFLTDIRRS